MSRYPRWNQLLELLAGNGQLQVERAAELLGAAGDAARLTDAGVKVVTA